MIAFDTSLLVRIAVGDNREQKAAALALAERHRVLIPKTVVLETEWVLRSRYGLRRTEIFGFLSFLVGSEGVVMEDEPAIRRALRGSSGIGPVRDAAPQIPLSYAPAKRK